MRRTVGPRRRSGRAVLAAVLAFAAAAAASGPAAGAPSPRIVGGAGVDATTVPWVVALLAAGETDAYRAQFCGGTLIDESWVLTAAHCVDGVSPALVDVAWGITNLSAIDASDRRAIDRIVVEPRYDSARQTYDVALLHLATPAIGAVTMPLNVSTSTPVAGDDLSAYGWGNTATNDPPSFPDGLRGVVLQDRAGPSGACGSYGGVYIAEHMVCAGASAGGKDACQGDSGGPLVSAGPTPVLVGVTSFGVGCALASYPGIWARVSSYAGWIADVIDPGAAQLAIGATSAVEGDTGSRTAYFRVTLSKPVAGTVTVDYATTDSSATAPADYTATSGTLTFTPGEVSASVNVAVRGDTVVEATETYMVRLSAPAGGAVIARGAGTGRILNDDAHSGVFVSASNAYVPEGDDGGQTVRVTVALSRPAARAVTVRYATADGTARAGFDYTAASGTVSFPTGAITRSVLLAIQPEWLAEGGVNETLRLTLSGASGGVRLSHPTSTVTILADD